MKEKAILKRRLANLALIAVLMLIPVTSCNKSPADVEGQSGTAVSGPLNLESRSLEEALSNGKPTLADFGSTTCIPCKNMKATLAELDPLYRDKVNILIVIVDDNQELVAHYQIMAIPTQIFFNSQGKRVAGHIGEMSKEDIVAQLKQMGIN